MQESIEQIVERIESESSHAVYLIEFENAYFNIMVEDFIENIHVKKEKKVFFH